MRTVRCWPVKGSPVSERCLGSGEKGYLWVLNERAMGNECTWWYLRSGSSGNDEGFLHRLLNSSMVVRMSSLRHRGSLASFEMTKPAFSLPAPII